MGTGARPGHCVHEGRAAQGRRGPATGKSPVMVAATSPAPPRPASRLCFGLQSKVMMTIAVELAGQGATAVSFVPIHPTAAAAAVLQNSPVLVRRVEDK